MTKVVVPSIQDVQNKAPPSPSQEENVDFSFVTRVKLDVTVNAPLIVVPENPTSKNALLLDCGILTVKTDLTVLKKYYENKDLELDENCLNDRCKLPPVIETQKVTLAKMEISK